MPNVPSYPGSMPQISNLPSSQQSLLDHIRLDELGSINLLNHVGMRSGKQWQRKNSKLGKS